MTSEFNMPVAVSKLRTEMFSIYLRSRGWRERTSDKKNRVCFEGDVHEGGEPYKLYLPESPTVPRYRTLMQRAVYFLCDVEDREPQEIIPDILTELNRQAQEPATAQESETSRIRIGNAGASPLQLVVTSRSSDHHLLPGESVELLCRQPASGLLSIEHIENKLIIDDGAS